MSAARVYLIAGTKQRVIRMWGGAWRSEPVLRAYARSAALGRAWWLVEAESADAARECIAAFERTSYDEWDDRRGIVRAIEHPKAAAPQDIYRASDATVLGRILASGGAK